MENVLKLYTYIDGVNDTPFPNEQEQVVVSEFRSDYQRMGAAPTITFSFMHKKCLDNLWNDNVYASFNGERFYLKQTASSSYDNGDTRYKHDVELVSERIILDSVYFYDVVTDDVVVDKYVSNNTSFAFSGDIHEFASRLNMSLSKLNVGYSVVVDDGVQSEIELVTFENQFITNVLQTMYEVYKIPYYFLDKVIHIGEYPTKIDKVFKYGSNESLISIAKNNANAKIINRITGVGSSDNIPYYYPNDDEKGITRALLNGDDGIVSITDSAKYRKVKLSDKFIYHQKSQTLISLLDENNLFIGNIRVQPRQVNNQTGSEYDNLISYSIDIQYDITLKQPEQVQFSVYSRYDNSQSLKFEVYKSTGFSYGVFNEQANLSLLGGKYSLSVKWNFLSDYIFERNDEILYNFIKDSLVIQANVVVDAVNTWTFNGMPIQLKDYGLSTSISNDGDVITFEQIAYIPPQSKLMPSLYRDSLGEERFYNAINDTYEIGDTGEYYSFVNLYSRNKPKEHIETFDDIKPTIKNIENSDGDRIDKIVEFAYDLNDNDDTDEEGNFIHPYFFAKLRRFDGEYGFNLFDHAIENGEMTISMVDGACASCNFKIAVDINTNKNTVQVDDNGNLIRDDKGNVRFGTPQDKQNDTFNNEVWVALIKDIETFGVVMPNVCGNYKPKSNDSFVLLHINLPKPYITSAEKKLEDELIKFMFENNHEKFTFSLSFSRIFFAENPEILSLLNENSKIKVEYDNNLYELYISSMSYSVSHDSPLPEIKIEISEVITLHSNKIEQVVYSAKREIIEQTNKGIEWSNIRGIPSWITDEKPRYSTSEILGSLGSGDSLWVIKKDNNNNYYISTELPIVTSRGLTTYASNDVELPTIAEELPYDKKTIWLNPETGKIEVIGGTGGGGGEGGMTTIEPLTINDNTGTAVVVYDGSEEKSITLSKDLVGLDKVDNIPDSDKYVGYARGLKNGKGTVYVTYGLIGSEPYNALGRGSEETWIQGKEVYFYIGGYSHATSRLSLRSDGSVRVGHSLCVGKSVTPNATLDVEGDAIISGNLKAGSFNVGVFKIENGIEIGNVSLSEDEEGNLDVSTNVEVDGDVSAVNANVTESVNIGGIKLTKLEDGVLKLDGHLVATGGLTTYSNDEVPGPNEVLQSLIDRISALESEVERLKNG